MVETRDSRLLVESAEAAAAAGDLVGAAEFLRELAELQHTSLGPDDPELAHTLNNLGVVHERLAHLDEAELCYRRAHEIAVATLPPDHPFVETSGRNLREFCAANDRAFEVAGDRAAEPAAGVATPAVVEPVRPAPPPAAPEPAPLRLQLAELSEEPPLTQVPSPPAAPPRSGFRPVLAVVGVALVLAALILARVWSESRAGADFTAGGDAEPAASPAPPPEIAAAPPSPPPAGPPADAAPPPASPAPEPRTSEPPAAAAAVRSDLPAVVEASLCARLTTGRRWNCEAVSGATGAGTLFFYTRLKSTRDAVVEHRWYQGDRLHRTVELRLSANTGSGYRTFSRQTITPARAGDWRVELRAQDGTLLDEARVTVR